MIRHQATTQGRVRARVPAGGAASRTGPGTTAARRAPAGVPVQLPVAHATRPDYKTALRLPMTPEPRPHGLSTLPRLLALAVLLWVVPAASAKVQFDTFPGYDSVVRSGGWFPVTFEIFNDGPGFDAVIEISAGQFGGPTVRHAIELPTNTRKRVVVPCFSSSQGFLSLDTRLLDSKGKVVVETTGSRLSQVAWEGFLLAGAPGSFSGMPAFPETTGKQNELQPRAVRLDLGQRLESFPENPIALEGLNAIYLNTARALDLKDPQVEALLSWVHAGGHLVVAIDQPADVGATAWLREVLPASVGSLANRPLDGELQRWLSQSSGAGRGEFQYAYQPPPLDTTRRNNNAAAERDPYADLGADPSFDRATMPLVELAPRGGKTLVASGKFPLVVCGPRGRGLVTVMAFNPERDPVRGWRNRTWLWARLAGVPRDLLRAGDFNAWGGRSTDAVFGAMIETRQVRKLPVGVLLALLVVYLVVIGPFDQWWLRRIRRPMLTWLTFPAYVALFSLLIYYIGFRLRAGKSEWNELHVVDILPRGGEAVLRGRTFTSLYSPANETYRVACDLASATLRSEFQGLWGNHNDTGRLAVRRRGKGVEADVYVPVWTSQMNVGDWQDTGVAPLQARREGSTLTLANLRQSPLTNVMVLGGGNIRRVDAIPANGTARVDLSVASKESYLDWVRGWQPRVQAAATQRNDVFGGGGGEHIDDWAGGASAMSLASRVSSGAGGNGRDLVWPAGMDLLPLLERGDTIVLAYLPGESLIPPLNQFPALRQQRGTLLRLVVPGVPRQP